MWVQLQNFSIHERYDAIPGHDPKHVIQGLKQLIASKGWSFYASVDLLYFSGKENVAANLCCGLSALSCANDYDLQQGLSLSAYSF